MKKLRRHYWQTCVASLIVLGLPAIGFSESFEVKPRQQEEKVGRQEKADLAQQLKPGHTLKEYRKQLADLGWRIVAVNDDNDEFVEYEVVKGDLTYVVQLRLDEQTDSATKVQVEQNTDLAAETQRELARQDRLARLAETSESDVIATTPWWRTESEKGSHTSSPHPFSDRDQAERMIRELETLPVGKEKQFYRNTLQQRGYSIIEENTQSAEELGLEVKKNEKRLTLTINFDPKTGASTAVDASRVRNEEGAHLSKGAARTLFEEEEGRSLVHERARLVRALRPGKARASYPEQLNSLGYTIVSTDIMSDEYAEYETQKDGHLYEIQLDIDPDTNQVTNVQISQIREGKILEHAPAR